MSRLFETGPPRAGECPALPNPAVARERAELLALLCLPDITPRRLGELLSLYGSPARAWEAVARGEAAGTEKAAAWSETASLSPASELERLALAGASLVLRGEEAYPTLLSQTAEPPLALFFKGVPPGDRPCVGVVGSRKATTYGREAARWLSEGLASAGVSVVSGAAYGIDSAAHSGALSGGGHTCAVLGCGVDVAYPRSNARLLERIAEAGCIISEYAPGTPPRPYRFPARNRIIAGMCAAVIVVEASGKSGALITADLALAEDREVMAVPGQVFSSNSRGTHALIRSGAALVTCAEEVLQEIAVPACRAATEAEVEDARLAPEEAGVLQALDGGPAGLEALAGTLGLAAQRCAALLASMEVRGLVARAAGGRYQKCAAGRTMRAQPL